MRWRRLEALDHLRRELVEAPLQRLVEEAPGLGRVVVGEHHERVERLVIAGTRDDVHGRAPASHQAAQNTRPVVGLVEYARKRRGGERGTTRPPAAQDERRGEHAAGAEPRQRGLEDAPRGLVLQCRLDTVDRTQALSQPLSGTALPGGAGRTLDRGQRLDDLAQRGLDVGVGGRRDGTHPTIGDCSIS